MSSIIDALSFRVVPGGPALNEYAFDTWYDLPAKIRRACLFDIPLPSRAEALATAWEHASHVCTAFYGNAPIAWAWTSLQHQQCKTAACHFILPPQSPGLLCAIARGFVAEGIKRHEALMCLVPSPYRTIRRILPLAGFSLAALLPGACHLALRDRSVPGALYVLRRY